MRGRCDARDGRIRTNSTSKIITVLIYMWTRSSKWLPRQGGQLQLSRSATDLNNILAAPLKCRRSAGPLLACRTAATVAERRPSSAVFQANAG